MKERWLKLQFYCYNIIIGSKTHVCISNIANMYTGINIILCYSLILKRRDELSGGEEISLWLPEHVWLQIKVTFSIH